MPSATKWRSDALARLQARTDLPPMLAALVGAMDRQGVKHEQEAWL